MALLLLDELLLVVLSVGLTVVLRLVDDVPVRGAVPSVTLVLLLLLLLLLLDELLLVVLSVGLTVVLRLVDDVPVRGAVPS
ncbi:MULTISPECIES: hypothetical protein, partial [unclassified Proteiniphilum]|uniref:hypothetical protein n=1 Tax=Proteiniphilum sp. UBA5480 TaxID=1947282 RepID=UPI00257BBAB7